MRKSSWALSPLLVLAFAGVARAQTAAPSASAAGFAADRFNPSERGSEWFALDTLDLRGNLRPAVGVVAEWADKPFVLYNADGSTRANVVSEQLTLHGGGSLVLAKHASASA